MADLGEEDRASALPFILGTSDDRAL